MTNEPVLMALLEVWKTLEPLDAPMAVLGGIALASWGHSRFTQDVDILLAIEEKDIDQVVQRLRNADKTGTARNFTRRLPTSAVPIRATRHVSGATSRFAACVHRLSLASPDAASARAVTLIGNRANGPLLRGSRLAEAASRPSNQPC